MLGIDNALAEEVFPLASNFLAIYKFYHFLASFSQLIKGIGCKIF
jgi:hypothetical protein